MIDHGFGVGLGTLDSEHMAICQKWRNDYRIWKTCRQNDLIAGGDQVEWFDRQRKDPSVKMYSILTECETQCALVGVCGLTSIDLWNRRAEFSLYIGPEFQGKGFAKKALQTLLSHAFLTLGLNGVWGETFDGNPAAKMFENLGMQREGTRREFYYRDGKHIDAHLFSLLRSDFDRVSWRPGAGVETRYHVEFYPPAITYRPIAPPSDFPS